jgi:hypothetical protein
MVDLFLQIEKPVTDSLPIQPPVNNEQEQQ